MLKWPTDMTDDLRRKPICGVMAVAVIAKTTFAEAEAAIKDNMLAHQKRHGGRTYDEQVLGALTQLGVIHQQVPSTRMTLQRWVKDYATHGRTYLIRTSRHFLTLRDGMMIDQYEHTDALQCGVKRCFVTGVWECFA